MEIREKAPTQVLYEITVSRDELRVIEDALYTAHSSTSSGEVENGVLWDRFYKFLEARGIVAISDE